MSEPTPPTWDPTSRPDSVISEALRRRDRPNERAPEVGPPALELPAAAVPARDREGIGDEVHALGRLGLRRDGSGRVDDRGQGVRVSGLATRLDVGLADGPAMLLQLVEITAVGVEDVLEIGQSVPD